MHGPTAVVNLGVKIEFRGPHIAHIAQISYLHNIIATYYITYYICRYIDTYIPTYTRHV